MEEKRKAVYVPETKDRIDKIKKKYQNMNMADATAEKIYRLEIANKILKVATHVSEIITTIDIIAPDPVPGIDETLLVGLTGLFGSASTLVENNIDSLAKTGSPNIQMEEVAKLSEQANCILKNINAKKHTTPQI